MFFFESRDKEVFKADRNKLFSSNEKQIDNHTFNAWHASLIHVSNVCTYHCRGVFNPLTPISDQERISPYNIKTISSRQVMRIKKNIS